MLNRLINILAISIVLCGTVHADVGDTVLEHGNGKQKCFIELYKL